MNFFSRKDIKYFNNFVRKGYLIKNTENKKSSDYLIKTFENLTCKILKKKILI